MTFSVMESTQVRAIFRGTVMLPLLALALLLSDPQPASAAAQSPAKEPAPPESADSSADAAQAETAPVPAPEPEPVKYSPRKLERKLYQVSNIEAELAIQVLDSLGYTTGPPQDALPMNELPVIFPLADTKEDTVVGAKDKLNRSTDASPQQRLMVLYHPSQRDEYLKLLDVLETEVDVPSRQVLIEALVIELSEEAKRELGFEYDWSGPRHRLTFEEDANGNVLFEAVGQTQDGLTVDGLTVVDPSRFRARLKAIIDSQQGEVLSSPSVLTLDNRQARIEVVEDVPIIESTSTAGGDKIELDVRFEQVGITLNIKPRVTKESDWVTMQVQTEVSEAPLEDFIRIDEEPVAPLINRRRVETIARIRNNTPFIIGGLIRNNTVESVSGIPFLSDIPFLGYLFEIRTDRNEKREVIIVVTPRVIEPEGSNRPILPKDSERFDFLDNRLFRNSYRLKAEDVFDLGFLTDKAEVQQTFQEAQKLLRQRPSLGDEPPFDDIRNSGLPGEEAIVVRMLYEVVKKLDLHKEVAPERLIYFAPDDEKPAGFDVTFLEEALGDLAGEKELRDHLDSGYPKDVLLLQYEKSETVPKSGPVSAPMARAEMRWAVSRDAAEEMIYEYSELEGYHRKRAAILIAERDDLTRLQAAVALREMLKVNNLERLLNLANFQVGRRIVVPQIDPGDDRVMLVDYSVANLFYMSDFYYEVFQNKFRTYYEAIRRHLREHEE